MHYLTVLKLPQYFRNIQRLTEILAVLVKHGFGDLVNRINIFSGGETTVKLAKPFLFLHRPRPALAPSTRLRMVCEDLGPTFIKLGQLVAARPDAFPESIISEFRKLQDSVQPFDSREVEKIIERELNNPIPKLFRSFDMQPLAAGSIAQVHRAQLLDGAHVVVKVRRPHIMRTIDTDMDLVRGIATLIEENIPELRVFSPVHMVEEFHRTMKRECDFRKEAHYMKVFASQHREVADLVVPGIYPGLCTSCVLTQEFIPGRKIDEMGKNLGTIIDGPRLARVLTGVVLDSIFKHRFFHADPHLGNVLLTNDNRIALIDFGEMGRLDRQRMQMIMQFIAASLTENPERMVNILRENQLTPPVFDEAAVRVQVSEILDAYLGKSLGALDLSRMLSEIFEVVRRYGIRPPADVLLIAKALTTLETIGAILDPDFDPLEVIKPYIAKKYVEQLFDPRLRLEAARDAAESYRRLAGEFPKEARAILQNLAQGTLTIRLSNKDLSELKIHQNKMLNRALIAFIGIVTSTLGVAIGLTGAPQAGVGAAASALVFIGAVVLLRTFFAIRKSGGI